MKLESLKDLENLIKLCRKMGIEAIEVDNVKMNLGIQPVTAKRTRKKHQVIAPGGITDDIQVPEALTAEEMLFYSVQGESN